MLLDVPLEQMDGFRPLYPAAHRWEAISRDRIPITLRVPPLGEFDSSVTRRFQPEYDRPHHDGHRGAEATQTWFEGRVKQRLTASSIKDSISLLKSEELRVDEEPTLGCLLSVGPPDDLVIEDHHRTNGQFAFVQPIPTKVEGHSHPSVIVLLGHLSHPIRPSEAVASDGCG
jgi:hypothetical protein